MTLNWFIIITIFLIPFLLMSCKAWRIETYFASCSFNRLNTLLINLAVFSDGSVSEGACYHGRNGTFHAPGLERQNQPPARQMELVLVLTYQDLYG